MFWCLYYSKPEGPWGVQYFYICIKWILYPQIRVILPLFSPDALLLWNKSFDIIIVPQQESAGFIIMKNSMILKKIIFLFLSILLPLILLGSSLLIWNNRQFTKEAVLNRHMRTEKYVNSLDDDIDQIYILAFSVLSRSDLSKLSYLSQTLGAYETAETINQLRSYMRNVKRSSELIENIKIYVRAMNHVYNASDQISYNTITEEDFQLLADLDTTLPSQIIFHEDRLVMMIKSSNRDPASIIEVEFSPEQLIRDFEYEKPYDNSYYLFQFHEGEYILDNIEDDALQNCVMEASYKRGIAQFTLEGQEYFSFRADFENIDASFIQVVPSTEFLLPIYLSNTYTIFFIIVMFLCVLLFFIGVVKLIHRPLVNLVQAFQKAETGDLSVRIQETAKSEFSYLYKGFNDMADNLGNLLDEVYNQKMLRQRAEFKQLQAQINPHFLYNSFFMLQRMIQQNMQEEALQVSKELGIYFRYITRNQSDFVFLKDEYLYAKIYSNIQSMRFEGRIRTEFGELPDEETCRKVPRLILQPIIENAYNYGLENKYSDGLLRVSFTSMEEGLFITVEDNGEDLTDEKLQQMDEKLNASVSFLDTEEITGLTNIHKRIQSFFKNNSTLKVSRSELGGLKVTIFLAKEDEESSHETIADSRR